MASQPFGNSNEFIAIETENRLFVLKGEKNGISNEAILKVNSLDIENSQPDIKYIKGLYLKEYSNYEIIIESKNNSDVEFYHENINIRNKITPITSKSKNLSGLINFKGDIGFADFIIKVNNKPELEITLEVYLTKISYKEDYKAILKDVSEEIYKVKLSFMGSLSSAEG